jgi:dienelactone hydrolase
MAQVYVQTNQKTGRFTRISAWWQRTRRAVTPGPRAWRGAAWGALAALTIILLATAYGMFGQADPLRFLIGTVFFLMSFALIGLIVIIVARLFPNPPVFYSWVLACAVPALALMALVALNVSIGIIVVGLGSLAVASLLGASLSGLTGSAWREASRPRRSIFLAGLVTGLAALTAGGFWLLNPGSPMAAPPNAAALSGALVAPLEVSNPSQPGTHAVQKLYYGSGNDRHRQEYGADVHLITEPVDGSPLIEGWSGLRTAYWGFGPDALPLNGRVWYPQGNGPFPLVLIVHGQHPMEDFSDPGYAYLGELLASRGFIVTSVDQNFLNLSPLVDLLIFHSLTGENDLRAWLLLEHLQTWRGWNDNPDSIFYQKVDMDQIALIGHSRGGEAVSLAAAFNRLPYNPDDANLRFDYDFNIRSVVGIAPVDGTTQPAGREVALENMNYLVLHGAHDMDVFTFYGERQYARVRFTDGGDWFKSAVYIYGANHGQFNTSWGRKDLFEPVMRVYNLEQLLPAAEQQQAAAATISAFLEATLHGETGYRLFFQDLRRGKDWIPDTIYLHQYQDARTQMVSTYEEDIDLTSTTLPGGKLTGDNLTLWREQPTRAKWENLGNQTVYLGWDSAVKSKTASYSVQIPADDLVLDAESVLVFSMADANEDPAPQGEKREKPAIRQPIDLTVEVIDSAGETARLPLSHFSLLQPQLEGQLGKAAFMSPFPTSEAVLQHFEFPLKDFASANPAFNSTDLAEVRFIFDRTQAGVIVLDNIGVRSEK